MPAWRPSLTIRTKLYLSSALLLALLGGSLWYLRSGIEQGGTSRPTPRTR